MATLSASLQMHDRMSAVLNNIVGSLNIVVSTFQDVQSTAAASVDTANWEAARQNIINAGAALQLYNESIEYTKNHASDPISPNIQASEPVTPTWQSVSSPEVFMSTGAERFVSEFSAADAAMQQVYNRQIQITQAAQRMDITPPGMLEDVNAVQNRMQALQQRVQQLNNIPVNLRTDAVNRELESIRGTLADVGGRQDDLNDAISRMDFSRANQGYRQINGLLDGAERGIRDNISAQEQFNQTVQRGGFEYDSLGGRIGRIVGMLGIGLITKNAADMMYDSAAQLEATEAKYRTVFTGMTREADRFIKDFQRLTPATTAEARSMASGIQDMLIPMGVQRTEATQMTGEYMHLIGALTNFNSATKTAEDVASAFQSAITGEYDSLKGLGIQVNETIVKQQAVAMGLAENTNAVSNAAKAQTVLELAYRQSGDALAAYNETSLDTTTRMQLLQKGFQDAFGRAGQVILPEINNLLMQVQAHMPQIVAGIHAFAGAFSQVLSVCSNLFIMFMAISNVISDNWLWIEPVIWGIASAYGAWVTITTIMTAVQNGFNLALLTCPLTWIILAIAAVVAAIVVWIRHVGGIKVAWLMVVNAVLTAVDLLKLGFTMRVNNIRDSIDNMILAFESLKVGILNALGNIKVKGLSILQSFINGAIGMINDFINAVNSITGASISTINEVTFATTAAVEEEARQKQREKDLSTLTTRQNMNKGIREMQQNIQTINLKNDMARRQAEIDQLRKENKSVAQKEGEFETPGEVAGNYNSEIAGNTGGTAANTAAMADTMDIMDEDLKYMRDAAEQEIINRFTLAELKLDINNNNTLTTKTDFDEMSRQMANYTGEFLAAAAEGGYF